MTTHRTTRQELVHFLSDMYSVEQQALAQLVTAPNMAGDPGLAADFRTHHAETVQQAELVRECLEAHGGSPSMIKDAVMKLGGKCFLLFARVQPETPGRLVAHAYAYEAMEWAGYQMLLRMAEAAGDFSTADVARRIAAEERTMMQRLERGFDAAATASHRGTPASDLQSQIRKHLSEAHALEEQGIELLKKSETIAGGVELEEFYRSHLANSRAQAGLVEARLEELGSDSSAFKDAAMSLGGLNWALFFQAQSDTPAKLAAFVYAFEHLKIAGYELLRRTAARALDVQTGRLCEQIIPAQRSAVENLAARFDPAVDATLRELAD